MRINYKNKTIDVDIRECSTLGRVRGLMFRRVENAENLLLFDFNHDFGYRYHTYRRLVHYSINSGNTRLKPTLVKKVKKQLDNKKEGSSY